jgi:hypothetical protein
MVSQFLEANDKETPSIEACLEGPKKEENKLETECNTKLEMEE